MPDESRLLRQVLSRGAITPQEALALDERYLRLLARETAWQATAAGNAEQVAKGIIAETESALAKLAEIKKRAMVVSTTPEDGLQEMISWHELAIPQMEARAAKRAHPGAPDSPNRGENAGYVESSASAKGPTDAEEHFAPIAMAESARRKDLHDYITGRGVIGLRHFTRRENLQSILTHGLLPKSTLNEMGVKYVANDDLRLDGIDGVCLSVSFPNYKLFWSFRAPDNKPLDWVVLDLSPGVVRGKLCIFNARNAAHNSMSKQPIEERTRIGALAEMFYDQMLRSRLSLPDDYTTDPQAEIVVPERIDPELIDNVLFNLPDTPHNRRVLEEYSKEFGTAWQGKFVPFQEIFKPRRDYEHWKTDCG